MDIRHVIQSQYGASLAMLKDAVEKCPASLWDDDRHQNRFWHIAYHALFYTHLYLQPSAQDFTPWARHREQYQYMGRVPWPPHDAPKIGEPYTRADVLDYVTVCQQQVADQLAVVNLEAASGFDWLPFDKLELQFYSIRHLQQHVGELCERLGALKIDVNWVGRQHAQ